jgi:hypothetical protein
MAEFSSCYFCGAALDAPLDEYPVVPSELHPSADQQSTVVLCPTCKSKLGAVIEEVIAAVETESGFEHDSTIDATLDGVTEAESSRSPGTETEASPGTEAEASPGTEEGSTTDASPERADESTESTDVSEAEMETTAESSDTPPAGESTGDRSPIFDGDSPAGAAESDPYGPVFGDADETGGDENDDEESGIAEGDDRDVEGDEAGGGETEGDEAEGDEIAGDEAESDDTAADEIDGEETGGAEADSATETTKSDDLLPDVRTYNRVIRLLQNREFPVDRDEIETVATNAYELSPAEFDAVIQVAIDRGVLAEEGGQLVIPEGQER